MERYYENAWLEWVDRWFGQGMTVEQVDIIHLYSRQTSSRHLPQWVYGLRYLSPGSEQWLQDNYLQWDYGLSMDLELLCHHRAGSVSIHASSMDDSGGTS